MACVVGAALLGLWWTRPAAFNYNAGKSAGTAQCLSNLSHIAAAFAQYAADYDGKFPRGTDAEDRFNPQTWCSDNAAGGVPYGGIYCREAHTLPMLQDLLLPYLHTRTVWRCPADDGYEESRLPDMPSGLHNVHPSAFARFGTSYSYFTIHGFAGLTTTDLPYPGRTPLLFDSDLWHAPDGHPSLNVLFADGHVQNLSALQFQKLETERGQLAFGF